MSDVHDFLLVLDLRPEVSEEKINELRWHLGLGPQPENLTIVTDFDEVMVDEAGEPIVESHPRPLLGEQGPAWRTGGALVSQLVARADGGWAVTSRQELHPDDFDRVSALVDWLAAHARDAGNPQFIGYLRPLEDATVATPLTITDGRVVGLST
ncbi:hypothetical protein [Actinophytocola xanthii]|uniref:Uncharacterized protein n=1 Tax=Actinophytocola xanthii TaxID=1912961 RepID=A0A1Q8CRV9_9PSEU|nr:hypothetical protein [Actinophytocola xanthii]OLF17086.1 hypothetical protein BU204_13420 [Actinophytocola xanthii]